MSDGRLRGERGSSSAQLLLVVLLYRTGVGILWAIQRQFIYLPDPTPVPPAGEVIEGARDVTLHTTDGLELGAWFVPAGAHARRRWRCSWHPGTAAIVKAGRDSPSS